MAGLQCSVTRAQECLKSLSSEWQKAMWGAVVSCTFWKLNIFEVMGASFLWFLLVCCYSTSQVTSTELYVYRPRWQHGPKGWKGLMVYQWLWSRLKYRNIYLKCVLIGTGGWIFDFDIFLWSTQIGWTAAHIKWRYHRVSLSCQRTFQHVAGGVSLPYWSTDVHGWLTESSSSLSPVSLNISTPSRIRY